MTRTAAPMTAGRETSYIADSPPTRNFELNSPGTFLLAAVSFGIMAGFGEGAGLLAFQHINWAGWARALHIAKQMLWISPVVDLCFFLPVALVVTVSSRLARKLPWFRVLILVLAFLTAYDWLRVTGRLYHSSCALLALGLATVLLRWVSKHENATAKVVRRSAPWLLASLALVIVGIEGGVRLHEKYATAQLPSAAPDAPNFVVIVLDTLRADHLSSYGYQRNTTPRIDKLAQHGVLFENAIASSSWSLPSHASLLTGRPVHEHGWGNMRQIPWLGWRDKALNGLPTIGEELQKRGYRTGAFSANSVYFTSNVGMGRGFLHFEDYFENVGDAFVRSQFGRDFSQRYMNRSKKSAFTRAFHALGLGRWLDKDSEGSGVYGGAFGVRKRADEVNAETAHWIQRDAKHPFFAFLNYFDVHYAYGGPESYPKPQWDNGSTIDEYDAGVRYADEYVGRLLQRLDAIGVLKNTVVIVTSDHGESLGDHGLKYHGSTLYRELVQVPLIVYCPGRIPQAVRVETPVSTAWIAETMMNLAGGNSAVFPGPPLAELWNSPAGTPNWPGAVSELPQTKNFTHDDQALQGQQPLASNGSMRSVFTTRWHLIQHEKWPDQIYDWKADPKESKNLINTPEGKAARDEILSHSQE
jgi:arylsulfatase A-like enzyme